MSICHEKSLLESRVMMRKPFEVSPKFYFLILLFFYFSKMWLMRDKYATNEKKNHYC